MIRSRYDVVVRCVAVGALWLGLALSLVLSSANAKVARIEMLPELSADASALQRQRIIDTRPAEQCRQVSLVGARCLGIDTVTAPGGRLADWPGITWLLGTHGLDGSEQVYIIGDDADTRHAVAAILHLAGQSDITLIDTPASALIAAMDTAPGLAGAVTRSRVYTAPMRSAQIVLTGELTEELQRPLAPSLLDGRNESAYWGMLSRGPRGGHIPGATHWQPSLVSALDPADSAIVYGEDTIGSLSLFGSLLPHMPAVRVYIDGWLAWSTNSHLPVDALSYPRVPTAVATTPAVTSASGPGSATTGVVMTALIGAAVLGFLGGRLGWVTRGKVT